jgi:gamma-glutamyl-gamma-aminobutyrate hydrolase PuuD
MSKRKRRRLNAANRNRKIAQMAKTTENPVDLNHRVTVMRDTTLAYPDLWLEVFVAGSPYEERQFAEMFVRAACRKAATPEDADLVIFSGGPDVDPLLYGQTEHKTTHTDLQRDKADLLLYNLCLEKGIPMLGICRGAQFLSVMNGGALYQDVDNHTGPHDIWDIHNRRLIQGISSVHHQMVMDNTEGGMQVLAFSSGRSTHRAISPSEFETGPNKDIEAFFYRDTCSLGIQGHPEYRGYHAFTKWSLEIVQQFVTENPDLTSAGGKIRIKPDILAQRAALSRPEGVN